MADLQERVAAELEKMAAALERSGARLDLLGVEDGIAQVRLSLTRPGPGRLVASLQVASGIGRALRNAIPDLRGLEAVDLPPYTLLGWDQPAFRPVVLPVEETPKG